MADRVSALEGSYTAGKFGLLKAGHQAGIRLEAIEDLVLHQIVAWPETLDEVGGITAKLAGVDVAPGSCRASVSAKAAVLRIEPLKWWLLGVEAPAVDADRGSSLDLSHSRSRVRVTGPDAVTLLNHYLSLDLREDSFPVGAVGSTAIHHVGVTLWRSEAGYELFLPRSFAVSIWEGLVDSAMQFGLEIPHGQ